MSWLIKADNKGSQDQSKSGAGVDKLEQPDNSHIQKTIAVASGKGGVGKSSVSALLASEIRKRGFKVGILDADVTGPSIPKLFGLRGVPSMLGSQLLPEISASSIRVMSLNLLLENEDDPVIWRGPLLAGVIKQLWKDVLWGEIDYMVIDLPPGTGDIPLTAFQSLPIDGVVIVSTPQELSELIVKKAVTMVRMFNIPILGLIENMSWIKCPNCAERIQPFGPSRADAIAESMELDLLGSLPLDPEVSILGDRGTIESYSCVELQSIVDRILNKPEMAIAE
jgi:Mrp family chromosome partitioning ATPase